MKILAHIIALVLITHPLFALAEDFTIEDQKLVVLPKPVEDAIRNTKNFEYPECKLIGKPIDISDKGPGSGFFATTADACIWGAAQGPIWVVLNGTKPVQVLEYGGYTLSLAKQTQNGLRNIKISAATAGHSSESLWHFDGVRYVKVKERARVNR